MRTKLLYSGLLLGLGLGIGCGGSDNGDSDTASVFSSANVTMDALPALSGLVSNEASLALAVSGTPDSMKTITENSANDGDGADIAFFNGAISKLVDDNVTVDDSLRGDMERGQTICGAFASMGEMIKRTDGGTYCYMQKVPKLETAVTVTKATDSVTQENYSGLFAQEAADKLVKIKIEEQGGAEDIFINIKGSSNSPGAYAFDFYSCRDDGNGGKAVESVESYSINFADGSFTREESYKGTYTNDNNQVNNYVGTMSISAFLRLAADGKTFEFDPSKERTISEKGEDSGPYSWGNESGNRVGRRSVQLTIDANGLLTSLTKRADENTSDNGDSSSSDEIWAQAEFTGSGLNVAFSQLAMKMNRNHTRSGENPWVQTGVGGAVEWQDTTYANTETGDFYSAYQAKDMAADSFFAEALTTPTVDNSGYSCTAVGDVEVELNLADPAFEAVDAACGGGGGDLQFHSMCYGGRVQQAQQMLWPQQ